MTSCGLSMRISPTAPTACRTLWSGRYAFPSVPARPADPRRSDGSVRVRWLRLDDCGDAREKVDADRLDYEAPCRVARAFGSVPLGYVVDARSLASRGGFLRPAAFSSFHRLPLRRRSWASDCLRTPNRWASPVLSGRADYPSIGLMLMYTDYRWRIPPPSLPLSILSMRRACPPGRAYALPLRRAGDSWGARQVPISRRARRTKRSKDGAARRDERGTASVRKDATQGTAAKSKA